jgi:ABC-type transport system involved in cytochrome bd biosynthesis fused ATPase/permease subunit
MKIQNLFLKVFFPPILLHALAIFLFLGKDQSEMALNLFFVSAILLYMIVWGVISYNWKFREKLALVFTLQAAFFFLFLINNLVIY